MKRDSGAPDRRATRRLIELIERELRQPRAFEEIARELPDLLPREPQLGAVLAALAEADRKRFWVKSQVLWFSRFGWRLIRPMMTIGILATGAFFLIDPGESGSHLLYFLMGVAGLYVTLQVYAHFWSRHDEKKLAAAERELRERLRDILDGLGGEAP